MQNSDKLLRELKNMDKQQLSGLLNTAGGSLNSAQQKKLKEILRDKDELDKLKGKLEKEDINSLINNLKSKEQLGKFLSDPNVKEKINKLFNS